MISLLVPVHHHLVLRGLLTYLKDAQSSRALRDAHLLRDNLENLIERILLRRLHLEKSLLVPISALS